MKLATLAIAAAIGAQLGRSEGSAKPACNASTAGQYWPTNANHDRVSLIRSAQCGELEFCARKGWRYRWERLTVRANQLGKRRTGQRAAECVADLTAPRPVRQAAGEPVNSANW